MFIVIEGLDGTGKSTTAKALAKKLGGIALIIPLLINLKTLGLILKISMPRSRIVDSCFTPLLRLVLLFRYKNN